MKKFFTIIIPSILGFITTFMISVFFDLILSVYISKINKGSIEVEIDYKTAFYFSIKIFLLVFFVVSMYVIFLQDPKEKRKDS